MTGWRLFPLLGRVAGTPVGLPPGPPPTVEEALRAGELLLEGAGIAGGRLDAECLLAHALGVVRWRLVLLRERRLTTAEFAAYLRMLQRREQREPVAYLVGGREFWSLPLAVSRDVLVPRPETETLVETALAVWRAADGDSRQRETDNRQPGTGTPLIVELCTGSGAVAIALARELPGARVLATDISWRALGVARANARAHGVAERVGFLRGDVWRPLASLSGAARADLVVANPPYVPSGLLAALMPEVRWEPRRALDGGPDGLRIVREIVAGAPDRLRPGGHLLLEIGEDQGAAVRELLEATGSLEACRLVQDLAGRDRVAVARRRG